MKWSIKNKMRAGFGSIIILVILLAIINWIMLSNSIAAAELSRDSLAQYLPADAKSALQHTIDTNRESRMQSLIFSTITVALAIFVALELSSTISQSINRMISTAEQIALKDLAALTNAADAVARGDFTRSVAIQTQFLSHQSNDEIGKLGQAINQIIASVRDTVDAYSNMTCIVNHFVDDVANLSQKIAAGDLTATLKSDYGKFAKIKTTLATGRTKSLVPISPDAQISSAPNEGLPGTSDDLANLAARLRQELARFQKRKQQTYQVGFE